MQTEGNFNERDQRRTTEDGLDGWKCGPRESGWEEREREREQNREERRRKRWKLKRGRK